MRAPGVWIVCALAVLLVAGPAAGATKGQLRPLEARGADAAFVPGELVVQFRSGVSSAARADALRGEGARVARRLDSSGLALVRLRPGVSVRAAAAALARDPRVEFAEPNYVYRLTATFPNDTRFGELWGLHQSPGNHDIDAPQAWDRTTGSTQVVVAVIDSGVTYDHPDLAPNIWSNPGEAGGIPGDDDDQNGFVDDLVGWDFVQEDASPLDYDGHGTHVAGTIGAKGNNAMGVTGVNWDVSIMALRAGDASGLTSANIRDAITYACANGADVVNGSFGGPGKSQSLANLLKSAACRNTLFVFAAGNDGANLTNNTVATNSYPCEYHRASPHGFSVPNVVCVGATNANDALAGFSNRGPAAVHLAAPGVGILSTWPGYETVWGPDGMETAGTWIDPINIQGGPDVPPDWARTTPIASAGSWSLTDSPAGNYVNDALTTIRNRDVIVLTGREGCLIDYEARIDVESDFDWFGIFAGTDTVADEAEIAAWSGTTGGNFVALSSDLSGFDGADEVYVRFFLDSDELFPFDGAYVDEVLVKCLAAAGEDYFDISGTSMATPHVAGVAALLLAARPGLSLTRLKNALLKGVDRITSLGTRVSTGGRLDANRSLDVALDTTRPNTRITSGPPRRTTARSATIKFTSTESGSTFQCRHDGGRWRSCSSPQRYRNLDRGKHTVEVRAIDRALNVDSTPAKKTWKVL